MPDQQRSMTAVILAGQRPGGADPLAGAHALHKGLIEFSGQPMIGHVLNAVKNSNINGRILIAAPPHLTPAFQSALPGQAVDFIEAQNTPATSISTALDACADDTDVFVTTCDHPLLTSEMINAFMEGAARQNIDAGVGCVTQETYRAAFGDAPRTFIRFSDIVFSGANLFLFKPRQAKGLIEFWKQLEANRKRPLTMARQIGLLLGLRYLFGWLSSDDVFRVLHRKTGAQCGLVALEDAAAAVDVDKPADIALVRSLLQRRLDTQ